MQLIYFFVFQKHTVFLPLKFLYPECLLLLERHSAVEPLQCFQRACPANQNCAEILVRRVHYFFTEVVPRATQLFVYFNYRNASFTRKGERITSLGAACFDRDLEDPRWMKLNRWGFNKCKAEGETFKWHPTTEFLMMGGGSKEIIPASNLTLHPSL